MANTRKTVKRTKAASSTKTAAQSEAQKAPTKRPATRKKGPAVAAPAARKAPQTRVARLAELLPETVGANEYVSRTLKILEDGERSRMRLRQRRKSQLKSVLTDIQSDITSRISAVEESAVQQIEGLGDRVKATKVVRTATQLPEQVTEHVTCTVDSLLDRVGLVRKSVFMEAVSKRPASRRRKAA